MVDAPERFMSLTIKNPATIALAAELARRQGVSKTAAIHHALSERLLRLIRDRISELPERDSRSNEEIIGFDAHGIPR